MVISADPRAQPRSADPEAGGGAQAGVGVVEAAGSTARALPSFPSLKTRGSHGAHVNRAGDAIARRSSSEKLDEVREDLLPHLRDVASPGADAADIDAPADAVEEAAETLGPWKLRTRPRRPATSPAAAAASASTLPSERRVTRSRADALDRPRFSLKLSAEEIEEDIYALTGARPRRRPRRRPRAVQKQLDLLLPGGSLSEITAETYRVPDDR